MEELNQEEGYTPEEFNRSLNKELEHLGIKVELAGESQEEESIITYDIKFVSRSRPNLKEKWKDYFFEFTYDKNKGTWKAYRYYKNEKIDEHSYCGKLEDFLYALWQISK